MFSILKSVRKQLLAVGAAGILVACATASVSAQPAPQATATKKPNILILWGDDIGQFNVSAYNMGMMGYQTPNIDRIAHEGAIFTDWYAQQSCTAGRSAFIRSAIRKSELDVLRAMSGSR